MNPQALHPDAAFSAETEFGERLINSLLTMPVLVGLSVSHLTQGTLVANLGFGEVEFPAPVQHGETIYGETAALDKRLVPARPAGPPAHRGPRHVRAAQLDPAQRGRTTRAQRLRTAVHHGPLGPVRRR
jgi:acyl dehydratase